MITSNIADTMASLFAMQSRLKNMTPAMELIGEMELATAQMRITTTKMDPEDVPWAPWSSRRLHEREQRGNIGLGILLDEGSLLRSLNSTADASSMSVASELSYAGLLQDGTSRMPRREFLGWSVKSKERAQSIAALFVEKGTLGAQLTY